MLWYVSEQQGPDNYQLLPAGIQGHTQWSNPMKRHCCSYLQIPGRLQFVVEVFPPEIEVFLKNLSECFPDAAVRKILTVRKYQNYFCSFRIVSYFMFTKQTDYSIKINLQNKVFKTLQIFRRKCFSFYILVRSDFKPRDCFIAVIVKNRIRISLTSTPYTQRTRALLDKHQPSVSNIMGYTCQMQLYQIMSTTNGMHHTSSPREVKIRGGEVWMWIGVNVKVPSDVLYIVV